MQAVAARSPAHAAPELAAPDATGLHKLAAWLSFPVLMGGFVALAAWGFAQGFDPAGWGLALTVANFFVIVACEQLLPRHRDTSLFRDRQSLNDVLHGLGVQFLSRPVGDAVRVVFVVQAAAAWQSLGLSTPWPVHWPLVAQVGLGLLLHTFADYWIHRSLHTFDRLWWFHSIHHDTPRMHILKSGRLHFGEELFNALLKPIPLILLGAPPEIMLWLTLWIVFDGNLVHSNIDQRFPSWAHYFVPTVQLHNLHHARDRRHQDSNYSGSTAVWDVLFGTFSHPDRNALGPMGIEHSPVPAGFLGQIVFPFRAQLSPPYSNHQGSP